MITAADEGGCASDWIYGIVSILVNNGGGVGQDSGLVFLRSSYLKACYFQRRNCKRGEGVFESGILVKSHIVSLHLTSSPSMNSCVDYHFPSRGNRNGPSRLQAKLRCVIEARQEDVSKLSSFHKSCKALTDGLFFFLSAYFPPWLVQPLFYLFETLSCQSQAGLKFTTCPPPSCPQVAACYIGKA